MDPCPGSVAANAVEGLRDGLTERFGASEEHVKYIIKTRGVQPLGWVGHTRIFSDRQAAYIEQELRQIWMERNPVAEASGGIAAAAG